MMLVSSVQGLLGFFSTKFGQQLHLAHKLCKHSWMSNG